MNDKYAATEARKVEAARAASTFKEASFTRLRKIIETKLKTTFVGAVARCEQFLGELWGHGLDESQLTPEQRKWLEKWLECRNQILTNGNNQSRALGKELEQYEVVWSRYKVTATKEDNREKQS